VTTAKDYATTDAMLEVNLIALKGDAAQAGGGDRHSSDGDVRTLRARR
jgi:hypothetical protein